MGEIPHPDCFDRLIPQGKSSTPGLTALRKTAGPALSPDAIGRVDVVLLSHDHHFDNLDNSGRRFLQRAGTVLTTRAGAERLMGQAVGLAPWQHFEIADQVGRVLRITATPARDGRANHDRGPVIGFVLTFTDMPAVAVYVSGDTVWYDGVAEVAKRFPIKIAFLFMGAARMPGVGPWHLTFTAEEAVEFARAVPDGTIVPLHFEGFIFRNRGKTSSKHLPKPALRSDSVGGTQDTTHLTSATRLTIP